VVKNRKIRRVWRIVFTVVCLLVVSLIVMAIIDAYEVWSLADKAIWSFIISFVSFGIFLTWKLPRRLKLLEKRLDRWGEKWGEKMRSVMFEDEEKHNGQ